MWILVSDSMVRQVQAGPPLENAALIIPNWAGTVRPFFFLHGGICTIESRGKLMPMALSPPGEMCSRIVVSERCPASSP